MMSRQDKKKDLEGPAASDQQQTLYQLDQAQISNVARVKVKPCLSYQKENCCVGAYTLKRPIQNAQTKKPQKCSSAQQRLVLTKGIYLRR